MDPAIHFHYISKSHTPQGSRAQQPRGKKKLKSDPIPHPVPERAGSVWTSLPDPQASRACGATTASEQMRDGEKVRKEEYGVKIYGCDKEKE